MATGETWDRCRAKCALKKDATGCVGIEGQWNRGCYVHTSKAIDRGNGGSKHLCAIAKSQYERLTKTRPTTDSRGNRVIVPASCVFPFSYDRTGITYNTCTFDDANATRAWCSNVAEYKSGSGLWSYCDKA